MKFQVITIMALSAMSLTLTAQKGNVSSADYELTVEKPDLEKAEEKILAAEVHIKTLDYAKTYTVKSRVYRAKYAKDNKQSENLFTALEALKKAEELNATGNAKGKGINKFTDEIKKDLLMLRVDFQNCGAAAYNEKNYELALNCFSEIMNIDNMPTNLDGVTEAPLDSTILFNTAICAYYSKNVELTEKYMTQCIDAQIGESTPYTVMYIHYRDAEQMDKMLETLKAGFKNYPEEPTFLRELVYHYIKSNDLDEGMKYILLALDQDPENSSFWFTKGTFHDQAKEVEKATEAYNKAIETAKTAEERYNASYNLGVIYYNEAVEASNLANEEMDMKKSEEMGKVAQERFTECIPFFESCLEEKPLDLEALKALSPVYYRLSNDSAEMMSKYEETKKNIEIAKEM